MSINDTNWSPHVTVAAIAQQNGRFLVVEEQITSGTVFNQPAGHWEPNETLLDAVVRETREETAYTFDPQYLLGIYSYLSASGITYLRFAFVGETKACDAHQKLDEGIIRAMWLSENELRTKHNELRSPMVLQCIEDYLNGKRFPLEVIRHLGL